MNGAVDDLLDGEELTRVLAQVEERIDRGEELSALDLARDRFMWGSPEEIVSEIGESARLAPTEFSVSFTGGMTTHSWEVHTENDYQVYLQSIETFGREIIPAFRD